MREQDVSFALIDEAERIVKKAERRMKITNALRDIGLQLYSTLSCNPADARRLYAVVRKPNEPSV